MPYAIAPQVSSDSMFIRQNNLERPEALIAYKKLEVFDLSDDDTEGLITPIEIKNDELTKLEPVEIPCGIMEVLSSDDRVNETVAGG